MKKNILVIGGGGREHALSWKINQSTDCGALYVAPGNPGTSAFATNLEVSVTDFDAIKGAILEYKIDLLVVGPEEPLVKGLRNYLENIDELSHVSIVGPGSDGAQLEGSKDFSKEFMNKHGIPTAQSKTFDKTTFQEGIHYLESMNGPYVLKADGLAAGKGVVICNDLEEAKSALTDMIVNQQFGEASTKVLIEQFLDGIEVSVFVLTDGKDYVILPEAKDYKRIGENDTGLNTGGMGAVSPVPFADKTFKKKVETTIVKPTIEGLKKDKIDYRGFIFIGLMNVAGEPWVIEYNVRMGDPETQVVIPRIKSDFLDLLWLCGKGELKDKTLETDHKTAATVVMVSGGYPEKYEKGNPISGLGNHEHGEIFHAGTSFKNDEVVSSGGRVVAVTSFGDSIEEATSNSYQRLQTIHWKDCYFRTDIGKDLINLA